MDAQNAARRKICAMIIFFAVFCSLAALGFPDARAQELDDLLKDGCCPVTVDELILLFPGCLPNPKQVMASCMSSGNVGLVDSADFPRLFAFGLDNGFFNLEDEHPIVTLTLNEFAVSAFRCPGVTSDINEYRKHDLQRRFCGVISVGGKRDSADLKALLSEIEDIVFFQVKYRMIGNRDRLAECWKDEYDPFLAEALADNKTETRAECGLCGKYARSLMEINNKIDGSFLMTLALGGEWRRKGLGEQNISALLIAQKSFGKDRDFTANLGYKLTNGSTSAKGTVVLGIEVSGKWKLRVKNQLEWSVSCAGRWGAEQTARLRVEFVFPVTENLSIPVSFGVNYDASAAFDKLNLVSENMGLTYLLPGFEK